ncbi:MAG: hypothetical protein RCG15_03110 [Candidatus Rickettsia vulgarisii]
MKGNFAKYNDSKKAIMLEILTYKICAGFQLNDCNKVHEFILLANPLLLGDPVKNLLFNKSILDILSIYKAPYYDDDLVPESTKSYIDSIALQIRRLEEIVVYKVQIIIYYLYMNTWIMQV